MDKAIAAREIMLLGALEEARAAALKEGIEVVPLKGAALLELGLYQPGERGMTDVDVLVRPKDLPDFEKILITLGYLPMPNSADAWMHPNTGNMPPTIIDIHTGLWHIKNTHELFQWGLEPGPGGLNLNLPDLFLHTAVHPLLHHGELTQRNLEDCARILRKSEKEHWENFWANTTRKTEIYKLRPALWPVITRLHEKNLVPDETMRTLEPSGLEKIKAALFERAARKHSTPLEYLLPVLQRPVLLVKYAVPEPRFMRRRYGSASLLSYALRPLRLLHAIFRRR